MKTKMFRVLQLLALVLLAFSSRSATAQSPAHQGDSGKDIFKEKCALCHAAGGEGSGMGKQIGVKDLRTDEIQKMTDEALQNSIVKGKGNMPAFADQISKDDLAKLVAFIRTLKQ